MKKILFFLLIVSVVSITAQNKQVLYDFAELPQTLLLNPGTETDYKFHVGLPLLSGLSMKIGSSGAVLTDVFALDHKDINDKISTVLNTLTTRDFVSFNTQIEVLSIGFRLDDEAYFSFGFYEEIDAIGYYPKDGFTLFYEGNDSYLNKSFRASQLRYKVDVLGVLHAGISRKINNKLTLGGRFKIYSSSLNFESNNNTGTLTSVSGTDNIYKHYLSDINIDIRTSGLYRYDEDLDENVIDDTSAILKKSLLSGNLGFGFDFGFTYHVNSQLQFSGSILDLGFINHKSNTQNLTAKGSFVFEGIGFEYNPNNPKNYWGQFDGDLKEQLPITDNEDSYISWRPTKLNAALKYSFGERRSKRCYDNTYKDFYTDAIGVQLYSIVRPLSPQFALSSFYEKSITSKIHTKVTYTIDEFSYANVGIGTSIQLGNVNFYGIVDNIFEYTNLSSANSLSLQLGFNVIFN